MSQRYMTRPEFNAILAGLRLLQGRLGGAPYSRAEVDEILNDGLADLAEVDEDFDTGVVNLRDIDELCEDLNCRDVQLVVEGDIE